jgi:hypothetical protein
MRYTLSIRLSVDHFINTTIMIYYSLNCVYPDLTYPVNFPCGVETRAPGDNTRLLAERRSTVVVQTGPYNLHDAIIEDF